MPTFTNSKERLEWELCKKSAHTFIFGLGDPPNRKHFLYTKDEHELEVSHLPFPDLPYLRALIDCFLVSGRIIKPSEAVYARDWEKQGSVSLELDELYDKRLIFIEKSRQVMVTWVCLAYILWRAKFRENQLALIQSKREADAQKLVCVKETEPHGARLSYMESMLPSHLRTVDFSKRGVASKCNIYFAGGSHCWGIPEGGSIIRSNTVSILFSDEAAFQPEFGEAYRAAVPALRGGGQGIFASSAEMGDFQALIEAE